MKKVGLIALALVLSLGLVGVGLAQWTETLNIEGDVTTGEVDAGFTSFTCSADPDITVDSDMHDDDGDLDFERATITVGNIYPCGNVDCTFVVTNLGSIPMKLAGVKIIDPQGGETTVLDGGDKVAMDLDNDGSNDITVWLSKVPDSIGVVAVGSSFTGYIHIHGWKQGTTWPSVTPNIYETNDASELASGTFSITIQTTRFNA